ncbi:mucin-2-like [Clinocottus analis]|uniref:mucin-2-like n=1 Tax=Clinocottus analis TaxID=304258 RepID=UPI0035BF46CE
MFSTVTPEAVFAETSKSNATEETSVTPPEVLTKATASVDTTVSLTVNTVRQLLTTVSPETKTSDVLKSHGTSDSSLFSTDKPTPMPPTASSSSQNNVPFFTATDGSRIAESTSQPGVESSTQTFSEFMTTTIEAVTASVSQSEIENFTDVEGSGDDQSASTDETPLETPTASDQSSVEQTTLARTTFSPLVTTQFIEEKRLSTREFMAVTTSPYTFETSQPLAIPSVIVYTSKEISTFIDMESSGGSSGDDDLESSSDGSGADASIEITSNPQEEFTVATDEIEINDSERIFEVLSASSTIHSSTMEFMSSTQSPHMTSTEIYIAEQGSGFVPENSVVKSDSSGGSTTFKPRFPVVSTAVTATTKMMLSSSTVADTEKESSNQTINLSTDNVIIRKPTATSSLHSTDNPVSPAVTMVTSSASLDSLDKEIKSTASSLFSTKKPKTTTVLHEIRPSNISESVVTAASSLYSTEKPNITTVYAVTSAQTVNVSVSATDESTPSSAFTLTEGESSGHQTTMLPSVMDRVTFGEATGETETFVSVTPTSNEQVSSHEGQINPDTHSPITSEATEPPFPSIWKDKVTVAEHITQSSVTTMSPHPIGTSVSDRSPVDFNPVSSSNEQPDGFTSMSSPIPSIIYHSITDQQVVIITPSSSQSKTDLTEQTPTMVLHVSQPSTSTTIIFTEDAKDEDELFSAVTDSIKEGSTTPERMTKDDKIIDVDTISIIPSSSLYPTIQTEEAGGVTPVTMTQRLEVTIESEGSGTDSATFFTPKPVTVYATSTTDLSLSSTSSGYLSPSSQPSTVEGMSTIQTSSEETVTSVSKSTQATTLSTKSSSEEIYDLATPHTDFPIGTLTKPVPVLVQEVLSGKDTADNATESITEIAASSSLPSQTLTETTVGSLVTAVPSKEYMSSTVETLKPISHYPLAGVSTVTALTPVPTDPGTVKTTSKASDNEYSGDDDSKQDSSEAISRTKIAVLNTASSLYSTEKTTVTPSLKVTGTDRSYDHTHYTAHVTQTSVPLHSKMNMDHMVTSSPPSSTDTFSVASNTAIAGEEGSGDEIADTTTASPKSENSGATPVAPQFIITEEPTTTTAEDETQTREATKEVETTSLSDTVSPYTNGSMSSPSHKESREDQMTSTSTNKYLSPSTVSSLQSTSKPAVMVQFVTTFLPERDTTPFEESFQQARSEIAFTHHPHIYSSSEKTVDPTTRPMLPNVDSSQHFEPRDVTPYTGVTAMSLEDKTAQAPSQAPILKEVSTDADGSTQDWEIQDTFTDAVRTVSSNVSPVHLTTREYRENIYDGNIDYSNPDYGAPNINIIETAPDRHIPSKEGEVFITTPPVSQTSESQSVDSVSTAERSSDENATKSPALAPVSAVASSSFESGSESMDSSEESMVTVRTVGGEVENITFELLSDSTKSPSIINTGAESGSMSSEGVSGEMKMTKKPKISSMEAQSLPPDEIQTVFKVDASTASKIESTSVNKTSEKEGVVNKIEGGVTSHTEMSKKTQTEFTTMTPAQAQPWPASVVSVATPPSFISEEDDKPGSDTAHIGEEPPIRGEETAAINDTGIDSGLVVGETVEIPGMFLEMAFN